MDKKISRISCLVFLVWFACAGVIPVSAAGGGYGFEQGAGYAAGKYDREAVQPAVFNWTRQAGFAGSVHYDVRWSFETGGMLESSPVIGSDGTIYFGSNDGKLYALDPSADSDGERLKWVHDFGYRSVSSPAIGSDGTVYAGSHGGVLYALNPDAADDHDRVRWQYGTGDWIASSPAIGPDGTVYVGSHDGKLHAVSPDGGLKWTQNMGDWVVSSPAIGADGTLYVGSLDGKLYAIGTIDLPAPEMAANAGDGSVVLSWDEVDRAAGYKLFKYEGDEAPHRKKNGKAGRLQRSPAVFTPCRIWLREPRTGLR